MKKKIIIPLAIVWILVIALSACDRRTVRPPNPYDDGDEKGLPSHHFETAIDAFNYGKKYFEETAKFYESTFYGVVTPAIGPKQQNYSRRYLSENGDFLYDSANNAATVLGMNTSFSLVMASKAGDNNYYYKMESGNERIHANPNGVLYSDYSDLTLSGLDSAAKTDYVKECGLDPRLLLNYIINEDTVAEVKNFQKGTVDSTYGYVFTLVLNQNAHGEGYRSQIKYSSGYPYAEFSSLQLTFTMDKSCKIVRIDTVEEYSINATITVKSKVVGSQYISYLKNPLINFNGFTVSYAE